MRSLVWFRRDLRSFDHASLYSALKESSEVFCLFVFDTDILDKLSDKKDRRVEFILKSVLELREDLRAKGGDLWIRHGSARQIVPRTAADLKVAAVYANHDYEPSAVSRDEAVRRSLEKEGVSFKTSKDQAVFEKDEVLTGSGTPFKVFTAYKNAWLDRLEPFYLKSYPVERYFKNLAKSSAYPEKTRDWTLAEIGFEKTDLEDLPVTPGMSGGRKLWKDFLGRIGDYKAKRDFPSLKGPSYLSAHLRFGTVSIRELAREADRIGGPGADTWLSELVWRDFYFMILHHCPRVVDHAFHQEMDGIEFPGGKKELGAWQEGRTGYPIVDAAMRQLNRTGWMHNRLRMIAASFLVKDLHVDWRLGEKYFAEKLLDFDLSANNGGWQWSASTGCDAQPYFRIFNPVTQSERFDADGRFIRRYCPELAGFDAGRIHAPWLASEDEQRAARCTIGRDYPAPLVDHAEARALTLELYKKR